MLGEYEQQKSGRLCSERVGIFLYVLSFKEILDYVPGEAVKVLEIQKAENEEEIIEGRSIVEEIL